MADSQFLSDEDVFGASPSSPTVPPDQKSEQQNSAQQPVTHSPSPSSSSQFLSDEDVFGAPQKPTDTQKDSTSFLRNPTWKNLGNAAVSAGKDTIDKAVQPLSDIGRMVYGSDKPGALIGPNKPIISDSVPETVGNVLTLGLPFAGSAPEGTAIGKARAPTKTGAVDASLPTHEQIRNIAGRTFSAADEAGGALPIPHTDSFVDSIVQQAQQPAAVNTLWGDNEFVALAKEAEGLRGKPLSFEDATGVDKKLTGLIRKSINPDGTMSEEGQRYTAIQDNLRDLMGQPNPGSGFELQNQAKALWMQQARMNDIESMMEKARNMSNPALALQVGARQLLSNGRRMRGFDEGDTKIIEHIASNPSVAGEVLRAGSSRLLNIMGLTHGPVAAIASQVGTHAARNLAERMAFRPAEQLMDRLATRNELPVLNKPYQARGGRIQKSHSGVVSAKPRSYPAIEAMRAK